MLWPVIANCLQSPTLRALIWPIDMVRSRTADGLFASLCVDWHDNNNRECRESLATPIFIQLIRKHLQK